ncbi:MAG: TauD/TfdA family dioxygenase [Okeania sp. SIO3I5]|uniref:TauD/TfdA family dioxygenase n=1 Tax=Okeania sp. SIO3I5 TaxID=2607805 RepID=UPI0013B764EE|nr:TauD/TfdA family dioxygenase [Okeania sp. SIO3I5]NEQ37560.1 TauD/TfdA family dioxygenase [Okeania sp. SIO3I5]
MSNLMEFQLPSAWTVNELLEHPDWIIKLTAEEIAELETALQEHLGSNVEYQDITKNQFPLPYLSKKLSYILDVIENGIGAVVLRGIPVEKYEPIEIKKLLWGMSLYLGTAIGQSSARELMNDLKDKGLKIGDPKSRYLNSRGAAALHSDGYCDLVMMLSIAEAKWGGESEIASSVAVHNEMLKYYPDFLKVLYEPFNHKLPDRHQGMMEDYYPLPIFANYQDYFVCTYARYLIEDAQNYTKAPRLSEKQKQALNQLDELYNNPKFKLTFRLLPGDLILINNLVVLHGRKEYTDEATTKRHLLRLWLSHPKSRPLPPEYSIPYRNTAPGSVRGSSLFVKW